MINGNVHEAADGLVVSNPEVLGGKPVFRGTRLPVSTLFEYLADGLSLDYFLESFPSVTRNKPWAFFAMANAALRKNSPHEDPA